MVEEEWTVEKVEQFAKDYGLNLTVKDSKGKTIQDYSQYLNKPVKSQNRKGKISTGVSFSVSIEADTTTYNLIVNYIEKGTSKSIKDEYRENHKNGEKGTYTCPGITGYSIDESEKSKTYTISDKDVPIKCEYTKVEEENSDG